MTNLSSFQRSPSSLLWGHGELGVSKPLSHAGAGWTRRPRVGAARAPAVIARLAVESPGYADSAKPPGFLATFLTSRVRTTVYIPRIFQVQTRPKSGKGEALGWGERRSPRPGPYFNCSLCLPFIHLLILFLIPLALLSHLNKPRP